MSSAVGMDPAHIEYVYELAARRYLQSLPLEHFMESTGQSIQREITLESFSIVRAIWPEFQVFSELLIQYPVPGKPFEKPARVVPDNMVVIWPRPLAPLSAFHTPLQEARPTLVLEYVSPNNPRKDYEDNRKRYERDLKVPYYLLFEPDKQKLTVFQLVKRRYKVVKPNASDRLAIAELELEAALQDGWVRFWFRGELLPLPGELKNQLTAMSDQLAASREQLQIANTDKLEAEKRAAAAEAELARLREELKKRKAT